MWTFARDVSAHTGLLCSGSDPRSTDGQRAEDRPGPRPASLPSPSPGHAIGDHRRSAPRMTGEESAGRRRSHSANIKQIARDCDTGPGQSIKFAGDINAGVNLISQSETGIYRIGYKSVGRRGEIKIISFSDIKSMTINLKLDHCIVHEIRIFALFLGL